MKRSLSVLTAVTFLPLILTSAEPSAFSAGDLNSPNPYGLTSSEKALLENKKNLRKVVVKSNTQANKVDSLRERIDGLQTIVESLNRKSQENKINLKKSLKKSSEAFTNNDLFEKRLSEFSQVNRDEIDKMKLVVSELSSLINTINSEYISKKEFNNLVNDVNKFKELVSNELKSGGSNKKNELDKITTFEIEKKAKALYKKKYYTKAIEYYSYLITKKYKPARSHYMIGEMQYYRKNYAEAISFFKKSASLYSKASYMPVLMYHTAIAMDNTGDKSNAKAFYNGIINKFPDSEFSKKATKRLKLLK